MINNDATSRAIRVSVLSRVRQVITGCRCSNRVIERWTIGVGEPQLAIGHDRIAAIGAGAGQVEAAVAPLLKTIALATIADDTADRALLASPGADTSVTGQQNVAAEFTLDQPQGAQAACVFIPTQAIENEIVGQVAAGQLDIGTTGVLHFNRAGAERRGSVDACAGIGLHHKQAREIGAGFVDVIGALVDVSLAKQTNRTRTTDRVTEESSPV